MVTVIIGRAISYHGSERKIKSENIIHIIIAGPSVSRNRRFFSARMAIQKKTCSRFVRWLLTRRSLQLHPPSPGVLSIQEQPSILLATRDNRVQCVSNRETHKEQESQVGNNHRTPPELYSTLHYRVDVEATMRRCVVSEPGLATKTKNKGMTCNLTTTSDQKSPLARRRKRRRPELNDKEEPLFPPDNKGPFFSLVATRDGSLIQGFSLALSLFLRHGSSETCLVDSTHPSTPLFFDAPPGWKGGDGGEKRPHTSYGQQQQRLLQNGLRCLTLTPRS